MKRLDYKWIIVALSFIMVMISLGFANSTKSLFPDEIAKALDTERSLVSIGESLRYISTSIVNLFFGLLIAKFGPKKLILVGFASLISSMLLYSFATNLLVIYVAGILLGIGFSFTTTTMVGYVVGIWCSENKGTIMGAVLASSGLGGAIAIQLVGGYIDPEVVGSYRDAYRFIAIVLACCAVLLLVLFRDKPKSMTELPKTSKKAKKRGKDWTGIDFNTALKKPYFWGIVTCIFFSGLILQGINGVNAMHMKDVGIDYDRVKELLSFGALVLAGAKFFTGFLYDKGGLRITASLLTFFGIVSPIILALVTNNAMGIPLAVTYSITAHLAMPLETVILPIYAADLFGKKDYAKILGIFVSANTAGYAVGSPLLNLFYDTLGSYVPGLFGVGAIMATMLIILQFTISLAHKDSKKIIEAELKKKTLRYK
jgi:MFS family permease